MAPFNELSLYRELVYGTRIDLLSNLRLSALIRVPFFSLRPLRPARIREAAGRKALQ